MYAKEIDFSTLDNATIHLHTNRNTTDKSKEASLFASTNTDDPTRVTTWWKQGPSKELDRIVESEHRIVILHVVLHEELVNFIGHRIVIEIQVIPLVLSW